MSDDDIEIVEKNTTLDTSLSGTNDICQLCSCNLHGLSTTERHDHYGKHESGVHTNSRTKRGKPKPASVVTSQRKTTPMRSRKSVESTAQEDTFWYPTQAEVPPDNYTPGVLSILKQALKKSHVKGTTQRAVLCYERTPHIQRESFDMTWGCGYRNFLMACAALMDQDFQSVYFAHLEEPSPPSVHNLQRWLEDAWTRGYDEIGAHYFDNKLVGTKKKVGTGDLYVAFTSRRIPCMLVDFDLRKAPKGFDTLTDWVVNYFTEKPEGDVNKYDGHSMTIVGYELAKNGKYHLLVLDPSSKVNKDIRQAALDASSSVNWASPLSVSLGKSKCRDRSKSPVPKKRSRTDQDPDTGVPDPDDENVDDPHRAVALKSTLDLDTVVKTFRLKKPKGKHDYQLLYFTLGDPLSEEEQNERKVVLSVAEC